MAIREIHYAVFDFETTGLDVNKVQPYEIACQIYNGRSLEPIEGATFVSLCKPTKDCEIEQTSLQITGIKYEEIMEAVSIEIIYQKFCDFLLKYNPEFTKWTAPIACGHNIRNFDLPIHERMMKQFCKKKSDTVAFSNIRVVDLMDLSLYWFENVKEIQSDSLNSLRNFFGIDCKGAHRGLKDVEDTGWIIMKLMNFHRNLIDVYLPKMKNAFKKRKNDED